MAAEDEAREAFEEVVSSALDHIMSFVHTPSIHKRQDAEGVQEGDFHNLSSEAIAGVLPDDTTPYDPERNRTVAYELQGEPVLPTSKSMTVAYYLKAFHGIGGEGLRSPHWGLHNQSDIDGQEIMFILNDENSPLHHSVSTKYRLAPWSLRAKSLIAKPITFGEDEYRLEWATEFVETNAQSVWIPGISEVLKIPDKVKKADKNTGGKLEERLRNLSKIVKPIKNLKQGEQLKPNPITPLTEYYMMRYMAPWLINQGYVNQAMPKASEPDENGRIRSIIGPIEIDRTQSNQEFDNGIAELVQELAFESNTPIDEMFAFERIRTVYYYPENYPEGFIDRYGNIMQPEPNNDDVRIDYGLLQQLYAAMTPANRKSFVEQTKKWVLDTMPKIKITRKTPGGQYTPKVGRRNKTVYFPTSAEGGLKAAEAVLVWLEESEESRAFQNEHAMKLPLDISEPEEKEQISEGARIIAPGLILLLAEKSGEHSLYDSISNATTTHMGSIDDESEEMYLKTLTEITQRPGLVREYELDETVEIQEQALTEILESEYEGIFQPINQNTARFIHIDDEDGIVTTITVNPKILSKVYKFSELESRLNYFVENEDYAKRIFGENFSNVPFNTIFRDKHGNEEPAISAYATETGLQMRKARKHGAKAFNALGFLVEDQMIRSAQQAARTTKIAKSSDFDKLVAALIGSPKHPGIAISHAALHYQKLYIQMRSPVKNWDIVEKDDFEEGAFLSLASFLESPAQKALYWMLNEKGFIRIGNFEGDRPTFFEVPKSKAVSEAAMTGLTNSFATVVIGYYRLLFSQIRQRMIFTRTGKEGAKSTAESVDLNKYWKNLMRDANSSPPDSAIFGTILRFFSQSEKGIKPVIQIPTWMPVMPADLRESKTMKTDKRMPLNYLKWAYGNNPVDLESFAETAAAYHAAKALSEHEDYPHMVERFINAVTEDKGTPFLFAILLGSEFNLAPEQVQGTPVQVVNFMQGAGRQRTQPETEVEEENIIPRNESRFEEIQREIQGILQGQDYSDVEYNAKKVAIQGYLGTLQSKAADALQNLDPANPENADAIFDLLAGADALIPEEVRQEWTGFVEEKRESFKLDNEDAIEQMNNQPFVFFFEPDEEEMR